MKKIVIFTCLSVLLLNVYGTEPLTSVKSTNSKSDISDFIFQETDDNYAIWGFYLSLTPTYSNIFSNTYKINKSDIKSLGALGYSFNVGYYRSLSPKIKLKAGIGIDTNYDKTNDKQDYTLGNPDVESKKANFTYISIPVILEFGTTKLDKVSFYTNLGVNLLRPLYKNNTFYAKREDLININRNANDFNFAIVGGVGITCPISNTYIFKIGISTNIGLNNTFYQNDIENKLYNIGIELGLYINKLFN
ncbi:MAG: hypothetical protein HQ541_04925 [Mariniphaga sp.]|nr:hypothetical protein [Mariniphaga sp.]